MKNELSIASGVGEEFGSPVSSEIAATAIIKRYPVLTPLQVNTIFAERNSGGNLTSLVTGGFLTVEIDPKRHKLLQNAIQDSKTIDDLVVLCNLGLIVKIAKKYSGAGIEFQDMMQEGVFGLYRCLSDYDSSKGMFSTFATNGIRNAITSAVRRDYAPVLRHPADLRDALRIGNEAVGELSGELQREPTLEELRVKLLTLVPRENNARRAAEIITHEMDRVASLDKPVKGRLAYVGQEFTLGEQLLDESTHPDGWVEAMHSKHIKASVNAALTSGLLNQEEARLIQLRFGFGGRDPMGHEEIGREVKLSRPTVARRLEDILEKLTNSGIFAKLVAE